MKKILYYIIGILGVYGAFGWILNITISGYLFSPTISYVENMNWLYVGLGLITSFIIISSIPLILFCLPSLVLLDSVTIWKKEYINKAIIYTDVIMLLLYLMSIYFVFDSYILYQNRFASGELIIIILSVLHLGLWTLQLILRIRKD
jgi:hypothetical protein